MEALRRTPNAIEQVGRSTARVEDPREASTGGGERSSRAYHHGDLRNALLREALRRTVASGYRSVVGREVASAVGVTPSSVYRHYPSHAHLLAAVARKARQALAERLVEAAEQASARDDVAGSSARRAVARFEAIGRAYVVFAISNPGLFEAAFANVGAPPDAPDDPSAWQVLTKSLDEVVETGAMDQRFREIAPYAAWSAVHGLAGILQWTGETGSSSCEQIPFVDEVIGAVKRSLGIPAF